MSNFCLTFVGGVTHPLVLSFIFFWKLNKTASSGMEFWAFNRAARFFPWDLDVDCLDTSLIGAGSFMVIIDVLDLFFLSLVALPACVGDLFEVQTSFIVSKISPTLTNLCTILRCLLILSLLGV